MNSAISPYIFPGCVHVMPTPKERQPLTYLSLQDVADVVTERTGITLERMREKTRIRAVCDARHTLYYLIRTYVPVSYANIRRTLGLKQDHSTMILSCYNIQNLIDSQPAFKAHVQRMAIQLINLNTTKKELLTQKTAA